ncbi:MAG: PA2817 family protein [Halieaceae bacterium]|jgi:hypothetical protein|nr:PA2817 family protein [Halieaceae bacterium]
MNDEQYLVHCRELLVDFARELSARTAALPPDDTLRLLAGEFERLATDSGAGLYTDAATLVDRLFTTYPDFAPTFPRELLWFFGGDCLHFMPDDEIALFQQLDEQRSQAAAGGNILDLAAARAKLLNLQ